VYPTKKGGVGGGLRRAASGGGGGWGGMGWGGVGWGAGGGLDESNANDPGPWKVSEKVRKGGDAAKSGTTRAALILGPTFLCGFEGGSQNRGLARRRR